jgi:hypothetical protein
VLSLKGSKRPRLQSTRDPQPQATSCNSYCTSMLCKHTPAQAGSCSTGRGAIVYFAGSDLRQSVLAALRSVERLEAAIGTAFHVSATIDLGKVNGRYSRNGMTSRSPEVHPGLCKKPCRQAIQTISEPRGTFQKWESGHYHCAIDDIQGNFQNSERKLGERIISKRARTGIGAEKNYCPFLSLASQTIFPTTIVVTTLTSRIFAGSMPKMSSLSRTMSASLPVVIEPFSLS